MVCTRALIARTKGTSYTNNWCGTGRERESRYVTQKWGLGACHEGKRVGKWVGKGFGVILLSVCSDPKAASPPGWAEGAPRPLSAGAVPPST